MGNLRGTKIILFHKIVNKTVPEYLSNLVPSSFGQTHQYSARNNSNLVHVHSRTAYYNNSFLPSTIRLWNELPANIKSNVSVNSMTLFFNNTINPVPSYFYAGSRIGQILHTRIRTESSVLKDHLIRKISKLIPTVVVNWWKRPSIFYSNVLCTKG